MTMVIRLSLALCGAVLASAEFDENGDYLEIADADVLSLPDISPYGSADAWTIAFWVKFTDNTGSDAQWILSWDYPDTDQPSANIMMFEASHATQANKMHCRFRDSDADDVGGAPSGTQYADTSWHHYCFVGEDTDVTWYLDNVQQDADGDSGMDGVDVAEAMLIGARKDLDADSFLGGKLAEFAKWDSALSAADRDKLAGTNGESVTEPDAIGTAPAWYLPLYDDMASDAGSLSVTTAGDVANDTSDHPITYSDDDLVVLRRRR